MTCLEEWEIFSDQYPFAAEFSWIYTRKQTNTGAFGDPIVEADRNGGVYLGANLSSGDIDWYYDNRHAGSAAAKTATTLGRHADYLLREPGTDRLYMSSLGFGVEEINPLTGQIVGQFVPGMFTRLFSPVFTPEIDPDGGGRNLLGIRDDTGGTQRVSDMPTPGPSGTKIVAIKRTDSEDVASGNPHVAGTEIVVYDAVVESGPGWAIYGIAFGRSTNDPDVASLFVLESNYNGLNEGSATVHLVELAFDWTKVFDEAGMTPGAPPVVPVPDTNLDGLIDAIEQAVLGFVPVDPDEDNDGLTLFEELVIYDTNPNSPDSDGDGSLDGREVLGGSDPWSDNQLPPVLVQGGALEIQPGEIGTRTYTLLTAVPGASVDLDLASGTLATFAGGATALTRLDGETFTLEGTLVGIQGVETLTTAETTSPGAVPSSQSVHVRDTGFVIAAQCAVRNCPCTSCPSGTADRQDGAFVNLAIGGFMWRCEVLPYTQGRNGFAPDWTLRLNTRAYSRGGWFGTTPATLACLERIRRDAPGGPLVYQEKEVREFVFNLAGNTTTRARYEVISESATEIVIRRPNGTRLRFHPLDGSLTEGALLSVENRFGDKIAHVYDANGRLETVTDVYGRAWTFSYDGLGRLDTIQEDSTTLLGRSCTFLYDTDNRLQRINTTSVNGDGGIGNQFPSGKPYVLTYPAATGVPQADTNVISVVYPREVLGGSLTAARFTNAYLGDDRLDFQVWGEANVTGGTVNFAYGVASTTVTDRNGNVTTYSFNGNGLATTASEASNRNVRGGIDPASFVTLRAYNQDEEITQLTLPLGGQIQFTFDTGNVDRYAQGNLREVRRIADLAGPLRKA